jgi:hypothetical protein
MLLGEGTYMYCSGRGSMTAHRTRIRVHLLPCQGRHLDLLNWARRHDCPWDVVTCASAAEGGHLDVLRWATGHGAHIYPGESQWYEHLLRSEPYAMDHQRRCR